jgi:predicted trehalose synthase
VRVQTRLERIEHSRAALRPVRDVTAILRVLIAVSVLSAAARSSGATRRTSRALWQSYKNARFT